MKHVNFIKALRELGSEGLASMLTRLRTEILGEDTGKEVGNGVPYGQQFTMGLFYNSTTGDYSVLNFQTHFTGNDDEFETSRTYLTFGMSSSFNPEIKSIDTVLKRKMFDARTAEATIRVILEHIRDTYRKPVSSGCVKALLTDNDWYWFSKRASSPNVMEYDGKHYVTNVGNPSFREVYITQTDTKMVHVKELASSYGSNPKYRQVGMVWYAVELTTTVYSGYRAETDTLGQPTAYGLPWRLVETNRSYTRPNGEVIFTKEALPYANYWKTPIHNYTTRIETLVEKEDLFKMGSVDLYSRRIQEEVPFLGWELEACCNTAEVAGKPDSVAIAMKKVLPKIVICKHDGSISPTGFETVSVPGTLDFWKETQLTEALNTMRSKPYNMRSYEHSSCGFHVHVSRSALSVLDLQKLERFMHNPDNNEILKAIAGRGSCTYSKYYPETFFTGRKNTKQGSEYSPEFPNQYELLRYCSPLEGVDKKVQYLCHLLYNYNAGTITFIALGTLMDAQYKAIISGNTPDTPTNLENMLTALESFMAVDTTYTEYHSNIRAIIRHVDPSREVQKKSSDSWKAGIKKSQVPFRRQDNKRACSLLKSPLGKGAAGRYDVLNTKNENTVEFRLFKGTMNPESVYRYLEFVDAIVRFVPSTSATNDGVNHKAFISWLTKDAFNVARYNNLIGFLVKREYIERKNIRKRNLPEPVEQDNSNIPESKLKIEVDPTPPAPRRARSFSTFDAARMDFALASQPVYDDLTLISDPDPEPPYVADDECDCEDCQRARGEID